MEAIRQWLAGPGNYQAGCELYNRYGSSNTLKELFARGANFYTRDKLRQELQALISDLPAPKPAVKAPAKVPDKTPPPAPPLQHQDEPPQVMAWRQEKLQVFKEASSLHSKLTLFRSKTERCRAALLILDKFDHNQALWQKINHYEATHEIMPDQLPVQPTAATYRSLMNIRSRISKLKKQPGKEPKLQELQQQAADMEKQLAHETN